MTVAGRTINMLGPGEAFGEIVLFCDVPRQATVGALHWISRSTLERDVFISAVTGHGEAHLRAENTIARFLAV